MVLAKNILVPVDFAAPSLRACDRAIALARDLHARVTLLHVIDSAEYALLPVGLAQVRELAERSLGDLANDLRQAGPSIATKIVLGSPWRSVIDAIQEEHADLVVCGTRNRRGLAHLALGSVAERIVRASPVPVLTVPGFAFESREEAGGRLMLELPRHDLPGAVSVVALGIDAVPIAAVLARRLGTVLDVWDYLPIEIDGEVMGAMGEDELVYYDELPTGPSAKREDVEARTRDELREQVAHVRGTGSFGDVLDRLVVLVAAHVSAVAPIRAAVHALGPLGVSGIILVTPIAKASALREVRRLVDGVVCLEQTLAANPREVAFRVNAMPSYRKVRRLLGTWRGTDTPLTAPTRFAS